MMNAKTITFAVANERATARSANGGRRTTRDGRANARTRTRASASDALDDVRTIARATDRGVRAKANERDAVEVAIDRAMRERGDGDGAAIETVAASNGRWRLTYTTEKETLWLLATSEDVEAYQTIDLGAKTLSNEVIFGADAKGNRVVFRVDASVEVASKTRVDFKFTSAALTLANGWRIPIPPFGAGWFDNVYVADGVRVSRDSRGDTLVCERA